MRGNSLLITFLELQITFINVIPVKFLVAD
jgi:hypothetical protein